MRTHIIWACIAIAAFILGKQIDRKEIVMVEKPVEVVRTIERVVEVPKKTEPPVSPNIS